MQEEVLLMDQLEKTVKALLNSRDFDAVPTNWKRDVILDIAKDLKEQRSKELIESCAD